MKKDMATSSVRTWGMPGGSSALQGRLHFTAAELPSPARPRATQVECARATTIPSHSLPLTSISLNLNLT